MTPRPPRLALLAAAVVVGGLTACSSAAPRRSITLDVVSLNDSGVSGSVTLTELADALTLVEIDVDPAGLPDMPAHVHPGTCAAIVPQPTYALENVVDGHSSTEVPAAYDELLAGDSAINLHRSNQEMDVYAACTELS